MSNIQLKFHYAPVRLADFNTFEEKLDLVIAHLQIHAIFCNLKDGQIPDYAYTGIYNVNEIYIPGGDPASIKSLIQHSLPFLQQSLDDFVKDYDDYFTIRKTLENVQDKCRLLSKKNDITKSLYYNEFEIQHLALRDDKWHWIYSGQIAYAQYVKEELISHYAIRKEFYEEIIELVENSLAQHAEIPSYPDKPYKFNSETPHTDIAELAYALLQTKIIIKEGQKGSVSKFVKELYNLFGLDDGPYHERLQRIRNRQKKESWLQVLPDYINSLRKNPEDS